MSKRGFGTAASNVALSFGAPPFTSTAISFCRQSLGGDALSYRGLGQYDQAEAPMETLVGSLKHALNEVVVDKTGLTGTPLALS